VTESIDEIASRWLARLDREDASAEDRAAFETWRAADPRHAASYARIEAVWNRILRIPALRAGAEGGGNSKAFTRSSIPAPAPRLAAYARATAASVAAVIIGLVLWSRYDPLEPSQRLVTEVGGYERAVLRDGSTVELNTNTEIRTSITASNRHLELLRGEATFEVARDPHRPFVVIAGDTAVRAVGTVFNVRRRRDAVEILAVEGKVAVGTKAAVLQSEASSLQTTPVLRAGQAAVTTRSGLEMRAVSSEEVDRELAWQSGMLSFADSTLTEATAEFNRYNSRQLVVSDPAIADIRVAGYFRANNIDGFVRVLESEFAIRATHESGRISLAAAPTFDAHSLTRRN
jgi:transmembrane sensor